MKPRLIVHFEVEDVKIDDLLRRYFFLPRDLRPDRWSETEKGKTKSIGSVDDFVSEVILRKVSPILYGKKGIQYVILRGGVDVSGDYYPITSTNWISAGSEQIKEFVMLFAQLAPSFSYACCFDELVERNQVHVKLDEKTKVDAWVGRNPAKYLPGLYWLTLIPQAMLEKHAIPLEMIAEAAIWKKKISTDAWLFQFYEKPEDWRADQKVANLLQELPGAFNVHSLRRITNRATNYIELRKILSEWT